MILVPIALVLFAAANMPTRIRALVRHPMLLGLLLWAFAHLLANGEVRSVVLFGGWCSNPTHHLTARISTTPHASSADQPNRPDSRRSPSTTTPRMTDTGIEI